MLKIHNSLHVSTYVFFVCNFTTATEVGKRCFSIMKREGAKSADVIWMGIWRAEHSYFP